jgi:3-ketosteroid 9alpha-monooxygenase subunit A
VALTEEDAMTATASPLPSPSLPGASPSPLRTRSPARPRFPFPRFPTGWFQVAWSDEVPAGQARPLVAFGKDLVIFRGASGKVSVLDAHCPHLGAHLGHGGRVQGDHLECPFHAWRFDASGACAEIPYATRVPPRSSVGCWPVVEVNGLVMVWHDVDRRAPLWEIPALAEFASDAWSTPIRREWKLRTHNQEMAENVVDKAHFKYLHGTVNLPDTRLEWNGPTIHMITPTTTRSKAGLIEGQVESHTYGLGFSTTRFTGLVETLLMGAVVPLDEEYVQVRFTFAVKKFGTEDMVSHVGKAFVAEVARQLEQDAPVWEHKIYVDRPLICDGDGPIGQFRRWAAQFYPAWYLAEARAAYDAAR